ncbi:MAG: 50S ribosomal protein L7/L12 [Solobacterium sp.]|nr:50S ribosomal protein L7/L12 [Solobacterium sp.]
MAKLTQEEILAYLDEATILELNELVKAIEEKYGVSAAAPVAVAAVAEEAAPQGPTSVTVVLTDVGGAKVAVIKAVREITGLGLVDAKKLVDALPAEIKKDVSTDEADKIKKTLTDAGATVEFK